MSEDNKRKNLSDELREAEDRLRSARLLRDAGQRKDAVSRAYYAAFHAAKAMLLTEGIEPRTHRGMRDEFRHRMTGAGKLPEALAQTLDRLEAARLGADYGAGADFSDEQTGGFLEDAQRFVDTITANLRAQGWVTQR